ncbi:MAG TPA: NADH-quinone oxidoreductase subunit G [Nitriliruptorales bacterium]|nr:NADH-quinone oxidoreductase subunit G [Nitriliruptorales bacterium]
MSDGQDTVTLAIDGKQVTVPKGTLIIRAAEQMGVVIPRFCDHPLLDPAGACRQCIVEVEGQRKPMTSCTTPCQDDMVVKTHLTSQVARDAQRAQLEFLLINHPLDCPMCDKGGECPLQDQALEHGPGESRFIDEKRRYAKPVACSPNVLLDRERCVLCARCTRFASQISGDPFIELFERGPLMQVAIYEDEPYFSYFSGNVIQICPVGALTSASYRFRARPFDLESRPSVCNLCSAGCNINVHSRCGGVMRVVARDNMAVNEMWNCDKGRFSFKYLAHPQRLTQPMVRRHGELVGVSWIEALDTAAQRIRAAVDAGPGRTAVLTGGRIPDEDAYVVSRFVRTVLGSDDLDFRTRAAGPDEDAALAVVATRPAATYHDVEHAPLVIMVGLDPEEEVPILYLRLRKAWRDHGCRLVSIGPRAGTISELLWQRLPTPLGGEAALLDALASDSDLDAAAGEVRDALRDAGSQAVIVVGERGGLSGALAAAGRLADSLDAKLAWVPRRAGARGALDAGLVAGLLPGGRRLIDEADRAEVAAVWGELPATPGRRLTAVLEAAATGEIDVLHLIGVDLARDAHRPRLAKAALERVRTVIVQDLLDNETAGYADIVLPAAAAMERAGTFTDWEGRRQRFTLAVDPPQLAQEDWDILRQLALLLGRDLGFRDLDGVRAQMARLPASRLRAWPGPAETGTGRAGVPTGDGALRLLSYPLLLDRGVMGAGADDMLKTAKTPFAAINRADAERLGVRDGQPVTVASGHGRLTVLAAVEDDVVEGVVYVPSNSTDVPAATLAGDDGAPPTVTVEPTDEPVRPVAAGAGPWTAGDRGLPVQGARA